MEDKMEEIRTQALIEHMICDMLRRHFLDLAAAFAIVDQSTANETINAIERDMARGLLQLRNEFVKGPGADHMLKPVAATLRETIKLAREKMDEAVKPN